MKKIIIVDNVHDLVDSLVDLLKMLGMDVVGTGSNGQEAVALYKSLKPDITILDVIMDDYDGFYAIKEIQKINPHAKFIVMTSLDSKKGYDDLLALGIKTIIRKPVTFDKIKETLNNVV
jgi:DNA-binding NarL/FixJ family response regulator